jgi:hypothetical protein
MVFTNQGNKSNSGIAPVGLLFCDYCGFLAAQGQSRWLVGGKFDRL